MTTNNWFAFELMSRFNTINRDNDIITYLETRHWPKEEINDILKKIQKITNFVNALN